MADVLLKSQPLNNNMVWSNSDEIVIGEAVIIGDSVVLSEEVLAEITNTIHTNKNIESPFLALDDATVNDQNSTNTSGEALQLSNVFPATTKKSRKRMANPENWKSNRRKKKCQAGEQYTSVRGKTVTAKAVINKKDCLNKCKYLCAQKVTEEERQDQFNSFYSLNAQRKRDFILRNTYRNLTARKTSTQNEKSRRSFSFSYFIQVANNRHVECKNFFLGTYNISQTPVYSAHHGKCKKTGTSQVDKRGQSGAKRTPQEKIADVKAHINSFPRIESHYCRAKTTREYLEPYLNISKMYDLYREYTKDPQSVKESLYRHIFCTKFNIGFHRPKSDRCGICEKYKIAEQENLLTDEMRLEKEHHYQLKTEMRAQKAQDKAGDIPVLCFDLQNVINCPKAEIGPMFYFSKLNIYNLTAYLTSTKKTYCSIWTECTSGRSGNDLASALVKILNRVIEDNSDMSDLITWSDSCVPQNKNSFMSTAILHVIKTNPHINSITMKYSVAGHGILQEVDNIHSSIEKVLAVNEFFSPIGLIRLLKSVNRRNPLIIMQMTATDFMDFASYGKSSFDFSKIPYAKLKILKYTRRCYEVQFCLSYNDAQFTNQSIRRIERCRKSFSAVDCGELQTIKNKPELSHTKKAHLQAMFQYMSANDMKYYKVVLKLGEFSSNNLICETQEITDDIQTNPDIAIAGETLKTNRVTASDIAKGSKRKPKRNNNMNPKRKAV